LPGAIFHRAIIWYDCPGPFFTGQSYGMIARGNGFVSYVFDVNAIFKLLVEYTYILTFISSFWVSFWAANK
jgi:hypothetical protein